MRIARLGRGLLLFEFESSSEAECVLATRSRNIKENVIILDRWNPEVGCLCKDAGVKEAWVRVVGLPLHLWNSEVFKRIRDGCGGFVAADEKSFYLSEMQWGQAVIPFNFGGSHLPSSRRWCRREALVEKMAQGKEKMMVEHHVLLATEVKGRSWSS